MADPNKTERSVAVVKASEGGRPGVLRMTVAGRPTFYLYCEQRCEVGGVRLWKVWRLTAPEPYWVTTGGGRSAFSCDCRGFEARSLCRHVLALLSLQRKGKL